MRSLGENGKWSDAVVRERRPCCVGILVLRRSLTERQRYRLRVVEFDGLHHARGPSAGEIDPFSLGNRHRSGIGTTDHDDRNATVSNPVTLAMRVIPMTGARRSARFRV